MSVFCGTPAHGYLAFPPDVPNSRISERLRRITVTETLEKIKGLFKADSSPDSGAPVHFSSNGTSTVSPDALIQALRTRFAELRDVSVDTPPAQKKAAGRG